MKNDIMIREPELYFDSIHQELNNFLRDTFLTNAFANPLNIKKASVWRPAIEVKQNDANYKVKVQLPGIKKDNINIELDNDFMTITAETHEEKEEKRKKKKKMNDIKQVNFVMVNTSEQYLLTSLLKLMKQKLNTKTEF